MFLRKAFLRVAGVVILVAATTSFKLTSIGNSLSSDLPSVDSCECINFTCSCCQPISVFEFSDLACVNVSSVDSQNDIKFTLSLGGKLYISDTYKDKEPWPSCVEFDEQGIAYVCVIFYNTTFADAQVSGCLKLSVLVQTEIIIPLKCFTVPRPKALAAVRGQNQENTTEKRTSHVLDFKQQHQDQVILSCVGRVLNFLYSWFPSIP